MSGSRVAALALCLVALVGCGSPVPSGSPTPTPSETTVEPPPQVTLEPPEPSSTPAEPSCLNGITLPEGVDARACRPVPPGTATAQVSDWSNSTAYLHLPSGNIGCDLTKGKHGSADCYVVEHSWKLPSALTRGCDPELECGSGVAIVNGRVTGTSRGDIPGWADARSRGLKQYVLPYRSLAAFGSHACLSEQSGLTCWSGVTGHGFLLSRSRIAYW